MEADTGLRQVLLFATMLGHIYRLYITKAVSQRSPALDVLQSISISENEERALTQIKLLQADFPADCSDNIKHAF